LEVEKMAKSKIIRLLPQKKGTLTEVQISAALTEHHGLLGPAADFLSKTVSEQTGVKFSITRKSLAKRIEGNKRLAQLLENVRECVIDNAESELFRQIRSGNTTATIFFLKCRGRSRGYIERVNYNPSGCEDSFPAEPPIFEVNFIKPNREPEPGDITDEEKTA
jgi:hypothetical protein